MSLLLAVAKVVGILWVLIFCWAYSNSPKKTEMATKIMKTTTPKTTIRFRQTADYSWLLSLPKVLAKKAFSIWQVRKYYFCPLIPVIGEGERKCL